MATVRPFRAVRPATAELAARVASVPYDVVDTAEAKQLAAGNPISFLHVIRPEIDLPEGTDPHDDEVYAQGATAYKHLLCDGVLARDDEPALFVYRQVMNGHAQLGVMGCASVDEYDDDLIKKHEKTRPDKEDDRVRHLLSLPAHSEPVFLAYRDEAAIDAVVARIVAGEPLYDFTAVDGVQHTVWRADAAAAAELEAAFAGVPALYVADGHHRCAAASRARAAVRRSAGDAAGHDVGAVEADNFLAVVFPAGQLQILPYHRVVHDLNGMTADELLARLRELMTVSPGGPVPSGRGRFSMYLAGAWHELAAPPAAIGDPDPVASLDAAILQSLVLAPLLGIDDPRTSQRIEFVGGIRGPEELVRRVDRRGEGVAFALHATSMAELMAVADAGRMMPPKSTWFEPKLRSGLAVHEF
ncbi:MAG TPA: DUF1015 family protein [Thermoanaerobaculia bacterium]|jgi:uncharacterized protein (DUF1015 family)|nr:DUF1015 family protein [Thermoanaerobaculia bacterium]